MSQVLVSGEKINETVIAFNEPTVWLGRRGRRPAHPQIKSRYSMCCVLGKHLGVLAKAS